MKPLLLVFGLCLPLLAHAQWWTPAVIWDRSGATDSARYGARLCPR
jgi:hypothetical protein